jgi:Fur family ferric uptake transcriptional regulator
VYDAVVSHPHADADDIASAVRSRLGKASTQGVYDALRVLTEQGLVRRIEPAGSPARFEARTGDNHHHVVCRSCGTVGDVDCAVSSTPCLEASETHGFTIDEAEVTYWGLCPTCQTTHAEQEGTT